VTVAAPLGHDLETRNRRMARLLVGLVAALVTTCVWIGTRW
jgi:hypothetical protein